MTKEWIGEKGISTILRENYVWMTERGENKFCGWILLLFHYLEKNWKGYCTSEINKGWLQTYICTESRIFAINECAKLRASRVLVTYLSPVPTCLTYSRALHACVPLLLKWLPFFTCFTCVITMSNYLNI